MPCRYLGLGLIVFVTLVVIELFGSPFMRNAEVIIALLFGYLMAGASRLAKMAWRRL